MRGIFSRATFSNVLTDARFQDAPAKFRKIDSRLLRRHRHEAVAGHAGNRVDLEHQRLPVLAGHEVDAPPARAADLAKSREREFRVNRLGLGVLCSGTVIFGAVGFVFSAVVVEDARGLDADRRQSLTLQDADRILAADNAALRERNAAEAQCQVHGFSQVAVVEHLGHADARPLTGRLEDERKTEVFGGQHGVGEMAYDRVIRCRNAGSFEQVFATDFVHCNA
jgi:hypothetical protein